jgi:hypothetical protein
MLNLVYILVRSLYVGCLIHVHQDIQCEVHPLDRSGKGSSRRAETISILKRREGVGPELSILLPVRLYIPEAFENPRPPSAKHIQHSRVYLVECCIVHLGSYRILYQPVDT